MTTSWLLVVDPSRILSGQANTDICGSVPHKEIACIGGKGKAGSRGRKAKGPRKRLKRILRSDDEDSLALYHPEAADKRFKEAQLEAEEDLVLSSLW